MMTTHYVCENKNPTWDTSIEFIVSDYKEVLYP